jgi:glycosyltransferase involved in cell wall biosynthesis
MKLSLVVPVFNEEKNLNSVVNYLMSCPMPLETEWIFIDDCSTDTSRTILNELKNKYKFILIEQPVNCGKGAAVIAGIKAASGDIVMIQDADFEYDIHDVPSLLEPLMNNSADIVYGSRFKKNALQVHRTYHYFVNRLLTFLSNLMSGIYLTDMETCYKIFKADLLKSMNLESNRFGIEVEFTAYIAKTAARIHELPINYYPRTKLQGKKINWKDGFAALWHLIHFNFFVNFSKAFTNLPDIYNPEKVALKPYSKVPPKAIKISNP